VAIENEAAAWIPVQWRLEVGNGLLMAERRGRITAEQVAQALSLVITLPLAEDEETAEQIPVRTLTLARKHGLTVYDAAYLAGTASRNGLGHV
jgi:predicted nucleic acid-binding protein